MKDRTVYRVFKIGFIMLKVCAGLKIAHLLAFGFIKNPASLFELYSDVILSKLILLSVGLFLIPLIRVYRRIVKDEYDPPKKWTEDIS